MTADTLALHAAVAAAAFFQAVTGIGFGMIAGPVILLVLATPSAMILTNILNWTVALALLPLVWRDADRRLGGRLLLGALLGLPVGAALLGVADVVTLKLAAGVLILRLAFVSGNDERIVALSALSGQGAITEKLAEEADSRTDRTDG